MTMFTEPRQPGRDPWVDTAFRALVFAHVLLFAQGLRHAATAMVNDWGEASWEAILNDQ